MLGPDRVQAGDVLVALGSSGLHSNGYSLVRHALFDQAGMTLDATPAVLGGRALGDELLVPTRIYALDCLALAAECDARTFAHITGGGLAGNLARVLPDGLDAVVDRSPWTPQPVFALVREAGALSRADLELAFNLGVGMVAVLPRDRVPDAVDLLGARDIPAWPIGEVRRADGDRPGVVSMHGDYAGRAAAWH